MVSAEIEKRKISVYITTLGCSVDEILLNYWNGKDFKELEQPFQNLTGMVIHHAQNHKVYSVLHFFHTSNKKEAFVLNITNLDETLTILLHRIPEENRPSHNIMMALRKAISSYLVTLPGAYIMPSEEAPPQLLLSALDAKNIPTIPMNEVVYNLENLVE